jgi:metalloendopeptidase OMA1, mitochondrial
MKSSTLVSCTLASLLLASTWFVTGCSTVPVTGRSQFNLVPASEELQLGLTSFEEIKKETPISTNPAMKATVQRVGKRIAAVAATDMPDAQWEFVVFASKEANAFCLPGGKVGVYEGIMAIAKDDAGLATIIGHEVAHAVARHGAERMSEAMLMQSGGQVLGTGLSSADPMWQQAAMLAYGAGAKLGRELPHNRRQELEADEIGVMYMARAGYNPRAALAFWQRFAEYKSAQGGATESWLSNFLSTHPVDEVRIERLQKLMPQAEREFRRSTMLPNTGR